MTRKHFEEERIADPNYTFVNKPKAMLPLTTWGKNIIDATPYGYTKINSQLPPNPDGNKRNHTTMTLDHFNPPDSAVWSTKEYHRTRRHVSEIMKTEKLPKSEISLGDSKTEYLTTAMETMFRNT